MLITLTFGQLLPQLLCEEYTIQFINFPGCYFVLKLALAIESLGITHFSWLLFRLSHSNTFNIFHLGSAISRRCNRYQTISSPALLPHSLATDNPQCTDAETVADEAEFIIREDDIPALWPISKLPLIEWIKYIASCALIFSCIAVVFAGIALHYSLLEVNPYFLYLLLVVCLVTLFYLEGLMIAIVATQRLHMQSYLLTHTVPPRGVELHNLCNISEPGTFNYENKMNNVKKFIMGRQFLTVCIVFVITQITVLSRAPSLEDTIILNELIIVFLKSGIAGALVTLTFSQLLPQLLASEQSWSFMSHRGSFFVVLASLATEASGITHFSRLLFYLVEYSLCGKIENIFDDSVSVSTVTEHEAPF